MFDKVLANVDVVSGVVTDVMGMVVTVVVGGEDIVLVVVVSILFVRLSAVVILDVFVKISDEPGRESVGGARAHLRILCGAGNGSKFMLRYWSSVIE